MASVTRPLGPSLSSRPWSGGSAPSCGTARPDVQARVVEGEAGQPLPAPFGAEVLIAINLDARVAGMARPPLPALELRRHDAVLLAADAPAPRLAQATRFLFLAPSAGRLAGLPHLAEAARHVHPQVLGGDGLLTDLVQALRCELARDPAVGSDPGCAACAEGVADENVRLLIAGALVAHLDRKLRGAGVKAEGARATRLQDYKIRRVQEFVDAHLAEAISLDMLAEVACMSRYHFARAFKEGTGWTPHAFVMRRRIEHCQRLLRSTDMGLAEIAVTCGFASQSHMSTCFRRLLGNTPNRYRAEASVRPAPARRPNVLGPAPAASA